MVKDSVLLVFPHLRRNLVKNGQKLFYGSRSLEMKDGAFPFMNWGYAPVDKDEKSPRLELEDESARYGLQMYHHLVSRIDIAGKKILEVGCGRGGGSRYIASHFQPESVTGLDLSSENINACKRKADHGRLSYLEGDAEALPFPDESFDVIINVESSHDYPNFPRFLDGVRRVLRKGGYFLFTDYRTELGMLQVKAHLSKGWDLGLIQYRDITANVVESLRQNDKPMRETIRKYFPDGEQSEFYSKWVRLEGSPGFNRFRDRLEVYASFFYCKMR
ncbi:MAG TPA: methyltransferase domain-containing protein [Fibrobacteria bacterium]|nr:methyltransferase domain-containing protein [Fibrobacteria bacterium]